MFEIIIGRVPKGVYLAVWCTHCRTRITTVHHPHARRFGLREITAPVDCHTCHHPEWR